MSIKQNLLTYKRKYLFVLVLLCCISLVCVAFSMDSDGYNISRREVLLRRIGHETLLQSGDSTSRVLPVKKVGENEYQVTFENDLTFLSDSLVNITRRVLANDPTASNYIVSVLNCSNSSVAYGYAISSNKKDDIVTCLGRKQPKGCYKINIKFKPTGINTARTTYFLGALPLIAFVGFIFFRLGKSKKALPEVQGTGTFNLGSVLFDSESRKLLLNGTTMDLTATESRVLLIFALSPNEIIERSRLQKEIWEDQGVIVGRSLDMFISKLRKKLEVDPDIKISVVRGKGYKLEIGGTKK